MTDTAQPATAAETEVVSDPFADATDAFKTFDKAPEPLRDDHGRFARPEIEAEAEEAEAESHDEAQTEEAADEAQPEVDMPTSWPAEHVETWAALPPETQALIAEREGQRDAAVNAKFQEAANVRKANEAVITEATTARQKFAEAADVVLNLVQPQRPPVSMLNPQSHDYNPDAYHVALAEFDRANEILSSVRQQREDALAQLTRESEEREAQTIREIEEKTRPALLKDIPDLTDPHKQGPVLQGLVQYAIQAGIPEHVFTDPEMVKGVTSAQLHLVWKAQQYDRMTAAKAKVQPKAQRPAAPVVKPGVTTSRSAVEAANRKQIVERLNREGSVEAGAAFFKSFKGT